MKNHSWAANALACSQQRFQRLLYETSAAIMLDRGKTGKEYWDKIAREKETARKLNEITFYHGLYNDY